MHPRIFHIIAHLQWLGNIFCQYRTLLRCREVLIKSHQETMHQIIRKGCMEFFFKTAYGTDQTPCTIQVEMDSPTFNSTSNSHRTTAAAGAEGK
jgi:hypothetical protein